MYPNVSYAAAKSILDAVTPLDPRIGVVQRKGKTVYYAFVDGYDKPAVEGTRAAVEKALGIESGSDESQEEMKTVAKKPSSRKDFEVTVTPKMKVYTGSHASGGYTVIVSATSREEAIKTVRAQRRDEDGSQTIPADFKARAVS